MPFNPFKQPPVELDPAIQAGRPPALNDQLKSVEEAMGEQISALSRQVSALSDQVTGFGEQLTQALTTIQQPRNGTDEQLLTELERLNSLMPTLQDDINNLTTAVTNILSDESTKSATITQLQSQIADLQSQLATAVNAQATPDQLAALEAQITALQAATQVVQNTPTTGSTTGGTTNP